MTVDSWFSNYVSENISIDSEKSTGAINSRNWLTSNIVKGGYKMQVYGGLKM